MKWPNDRKFVDAQGKILDHWRGPIGILEPLLALTPAQFTALRALIAAAQEGGDEGSDPFDLPIDDTPDFDRDYLIGLGNSPYKMPMSLFSSRPVLLGSGSLSGASVSFAVPSGYINLRAIIKGYTPSSTGAIRMSMSEDGGASNVFSAFVAFNDAGSGGNISSEFPTASAVQVTSAQTANAFFEVGDYQGSADKFLFFGAFNLVTGSGALGWGLTTSSRPINSVAFSPSAGTWSAGTVELWGMS